MYREYSRLEPAFERVSGVTSKFETSVYVVLVEASDPRRTNGTDWCMTLRVVDPLSPDDFGSVELVLFSANVQLLPQMKVPSYGQLHAPTGSVAPGDILRLYGVTLQRYRGKPQMMMKLKDHRQWAVFSMEPPTPDQRYRPYAGSTNLPPSMTPADVKELDALRAAMDMQLDPPLQQPLQPPMVPHTIPTPMSYVGNVAGMQPHGMSAMPTSAGSLGSHGPTSGPRWPPNQPTCAPSVVDGQQVCAGVPAGGPVSCDGVAVLQAGPPTSAATHMEVAHPHPLHLQPQPLAAPPLQPGLRPVGYITLAPPPLQQGTAAPIAQGPGSVVPAAHKATSAAPQVAAKAMQVLQPPTYPVAHGEPKHASLAQVLDHCQSTTPVLLDLSVQVVACDRRANIGNGLSAVLYVWDGTDVPPAANRQNTLPAVPHAAPHLPALPLMRRALPLSSLPGPQALDAVTHTGGVEVADPLPIVGSVMPVLVPAGVPPQSLPAVGSGWLKVRKLSVFLCEGQVQGVWHGKTQGKAIGPKAPPVVAEAALRVQRAAQALEAPVGHHNMHGGHKLCTTVPAGLHADVRRVSVRQVLLACQGRHAPDLGPWRIIAQLDAHYPEDLSQAVVPRWNAPMLLPEDCCQGHAVLLKVRLRDATGELEAVLVGAHAMRFFQASVDWEATDRADWAQGMHAALEELEPQGGSSVAGSRVAGTRGLVQQQPGGLWGEYCLRGLCWDAQRHRETMVLRIVDTHIV